jgi:hypothetical protein
MPKPRSGPKVKCPPTKCSYTIADQDVWGVEFDAKLAGQDYSRLFYVPSTNKLYQWRRDVEPQRFVYVKSKLSEKRMESLRKAWLAGAEKILA